MKNLISILMFLSLILMCNILSAQNEVGLKDGGLRFDWIDQTQDFRKLWLSRTDILNGSYGYKFTWRNDDGSRRIDPLVFDATGNTYFLEGNVGIGTTSPQAKLHITSNAELLNLEGNDHAYMQFFPQGFGSGRKAYLGFGTANSDDFDIVNESSASDADINITSEDDIFITANGDDIVLVAEDDISFQTGGTNDRLRITQDGNVGIGTINPDANLTVQGGQGPIVKIVPTTSNFDLVNGDGDFRIGTDDNHLEFAASIGGGGAGIMRIQADGATLANPGQLWFGTDGLSFLHLREAKVGIGVSIPSFTLEVDGSAGKPGGGDWSNASDRRLKKDIEDFKDGLDQILQIRPVWYRYNGRFGLPTEERYVGVIAQEIQEVAPYTVTPYQQTDEKTGEQSEFLSYNGTAVTYMLVNAVQDQQQLIEEKEARITELEAKAKKIDELEERLAKLEALLNKPSALSETQTDVHIQSKNQARLEQNAPNPFNENTVIEYFLPEGITNAYLRIADQMGKVLQLIKLETTGQGQVNLTTDELPSGTYSYSLILDGKLLETKQMILTR